MWGCSSSGRALRSQRRGSEFDPRQLHHNLKVVVEVQYYISNIAHTN